MTPNRRRFLKLAGAAALIPAAPHVVRAQGGYPNRPVRLIVGQAAGSSSDITARLIGQWLSEKLGQQFVVEARPGATGNIATEFVARAPAAATRCFCSTPRTPSTPRCTTSSASTFSATSCRWRASTA